MRGIIFISIAVLLAINNIFVNFRIGSISFDRLLEFGIFFIFLKSYVKEIKTNAFFRKYNTYIVVFAIIQLLMNFKLLMFEDMPIKIIYVSLIKCFSYIVFSYLFLLIAKENTKYINIIIWVHLGICLFALLHHPMSPLSGQIHELKTILYKGVGGNAGLAKKLEGQSLYIELGLGNRFRASGPFASAIAFSYFLINTLFLNIFMYMRTKKNMYLIIIGFVMVCSFLTQTRSLILAELIIILGIWLYMNNKKLNSYKVAAAIAVLALSPIVLNKISSVSQSGENSRLTQLNDKGSDRELLWLTGLYAVASHPFGITDDQYADIRREMYYSSGSLSVLHMPSHNGFINTGFNYTIFGYLIMIGFFIFMYRSGKYLSKYYKILFFTFFIAYFVHSSFHNNFLFYADYEVYMVIMLMSVQYYHEKNNKQDSKPVLNGIG